jgi:hypothetical protein
MDAELCDDAETPDEGHQFNPQWHWRTHSLDLQNTREMLQEHPQFLPKPALHREADEPHDFIANPQLTPIIRYVAYAWSVQRDD